MALAFCVLSIGGALPEAVPELMTMLLFGSGLARVAANVRMRRKAGKAAALQTRE